MLRKMNPGVGELTDPQYAVVKQLRIPVAVVITFRIEGVRFGRSSSLSRGTRTSKELSRSCPNDRVSITELDPFIVSCR